jgi:hypothetical protein
MRYFAFLKACTQPIWTVYRWFAECREQTLFLLKFDTSKGNVERALRTKFESDRIYITNTDTVTDNTIYLASAELEEIVYLDAWLGTLEELTPIERTYFDDTLYLDFFIAPKATLADFTVHVPAGTDAVYHTEIVQFTEQFTLPGFRFQLQIF